MESVIVIFISVLNTVVFMLTLVCFFWFVISKQFESTILSKVDILVLIAQKDAIVKQFILAEISENYSELVATANENGAVRNAYNFNLLKNKLGPFIYAFFSILFLLSIYILIQRIKLDKMDKILVGLVALVFSTELIFYVVVLRNWVFLGDQITMKYILQDGNGT